MLLVLVASGIIAALPFLTDGYLTYLDNPVHLAEIHSLAFDARSGWSDLSYGGFALGELQSPIWYGAAAFFVRAGVPLEPLYITLVFLAYVAPALALYVIARRSLCPILAGVVSALFLLQRPFLVGTGSVLGGMWTFSLALAGIVLLLDRLASYSRDLGDATLIAVLVAAIGSTHVFGLIVLALIALVHGVILLASSANTRGLRRSLLLVAVAFAIGVLAAAPNWLPALFTRNIWTALGTENLDAAHLWEHLVGTGDTLAHRLADSSAAIYGVDVILEWLLLVAGLAGAALAFRRGAGETGNTARYALLLGASLGVLLFLVLPGTQLAILGPLSWRFLAVVRLTLAMCAIPLFERFGFRHRSVVFQGSALLLTAALALTVAAASSIPLRMHTASRSSAEMHDFLNVAANLSRARQPTWGRVFVQDTFFSRVDARDSPTLLMYSHIGALMPRLAGIHAVGTYYGVVPVSTYLLTSEFDTLFGEDAFAWSAEELAAKFDAINVTHVLVCDSILADKLRPSDSFRLVFQTGRFALFARTGARSSFVRALTGDAIVADERYRTGEVTATLRTDRFGDGVRVLTGYHPFWRLDSPASARLGQQDGMLVVGNLPVGDSELHLHYQPSRAPWLFGVAGWVGIAASGLVTRSRRYI